MGWQDTALMRVWNRSAVGNPANWYLLLGLVLIAFTLWVPWLTAARTARIEMRADRIAECLLAASSQQPWPPDAAAREHVLARLLALAASSEVFVGDLELVEPQPAEGLLWLTNKHYAFQLSASPIDVRATAGRGTVPALEVIAWPLADAGPAHSCYYYPENASRAYTRNLTANYVGWQEARPAPGAGQRRSQAMLDGQVAYRSEGDERWVLF